MDHSERGTTTVAFQLEGLELLSDPGAVFSQTKEWARSVGIVSDRPTHAITNAARTWGADYGFHSGPRGLLESLGPIRQQPEHDADRYLLIGTVDVDAQAVSERGWVFLSIADAADAAGWRLAEEGTASESEQAERDWP